MGLIREASGSRDCQTCADIWLAASLVAHDFIDGDFWRAQRAAMAEMYLPEADLLLMIERDGQAAGFAAMKGRRLAALFVRPATQGRGLGRELMLHLFGLYPEMELAVYRKNPRAAAFYQSLGFEPAGEGFCAHSGEAEIRMKKSPRH